LDVATACAADAIVSLSVSVDVRPRSFENAGEGSISAILQAVQFFTI